MDIGKIKNIRVNINEFKNPEFYKQNQKKIIKISAVLFLLLFSVYSIFFSPPSDFPTDHIIHIEEGSSLGEIARTLGDRDVIKFASLFKVLAVVTGNQSELVAGDYLFHKKINLFRVLNRLEEGEYDLSPVLVTFPEGVTVSEIGEILSDNFPDFKEVEFLRLARDKEGYLFPDTYKFFPNVGPRQVIFEMENNFRKKVENLLPEIESSGYSLHEILTMASLLEEEARTREARRMISGILWKRIEIGMRLQVDAVFPYIIGKNTFELSLDDLDFDSPYNTYKYAGLPPGPISSPGISSIEATLRPVKSDYLFYLSDMEGNMHYAETFEGHKRNKALYLR